MHPEYVNETARLEEQYGALSDENLLALNKIFDDLTDEAQQALKAELRNRRLSPSPSSTTTHETQTLANDYEFGIHRTLEKDGLVYLFGSLDGHELMLVCDHLSEAGVDLAFEAPEPGAIFSHVLVPAAEVDHAQQVLRETRGLFPLPETDARQVEGKGYIDDGELLILGQFEDQSERGQTAQILSNAGIEYTLRSGDPEEYNPVLLIEVHASDFNRALELVTRGLGVE